MSQNAKAGQGEPGVLRQVPSVSCLLEHPRVKDLAARVGRAMAVYAVRRATEDARSEAKKAGAVASVDDIASHATEVARRVCDPTLKPVINATGVVLHTNLGRAPLGPEVMKAVARIATGYSNLEFDLARGRRGSRSEHVLEILRFLTGAEDIVIVNNNAAGIVLALNTLANGREVVISRGELVEIGGSFRVPEIMAASGVRMVEVGTTNRTHASDYEGAIGPDTGLLFKAHRSNYSIQGFTQEVPVGELAAIAHKRGLSLVYDIGSGLLGKVAGMPWLTEPDVRTAIAEGADLVTFSGDKLMGGPQAGVVAGRADLVGRLAEAPLMRAFRVGKLTLAGLFSVCRLYLDDAGGAGVPTLKALSRSKEDLTEMAEALRHELSARGISARVVASVGRCGGGGLPETELESMAVELVAAAESRAARSRFAEDTFHRLLRAEPPVVGVLREGRLVLDMMALGDDMPGVAATVAAALGTEAGR